MKTGLINTALIVAALSTAVSFAEAHPAGGTSDLAHGVDHLLANPEHGLLHLLSLAGIVASLGAGIYVMRRLWRMRTERQKQSAVRRP